MSCKDKLEAFLRENEVAYQMHHHPRAFTAQEVAASEHIPGVELANVVMVVADGKLAMLVLPAPERVYLPEVARALDAHEVRLAHEPEFASNFSDCEVGAMPPFGNLYNVPVYVDSTLAAEEIIYFQAGTHTDTISMSYDDFERLVKPIVTSFSFELLITIGG